MCDRLYDFIKPKLYRKQFGFRPKNSTEHPILDLRGGYTPDFYYRYFCVCPPATDIPYMPHPYKWYKTIDIDFFFNFEHLKNFNFFSFSGNPQIEKIFFSSTFDFQKYSAPTFLNIFSKLQKEVSDKTHGHLTTHPDF